MEPSPTTPTPASPTAPMTPAAPLAAASVPTEASPTPPEAAVLEQLLFEVKKVIVGQDRAIERMIACLIAGGHCLLESVPGLAKTLAVETLATSVGGTFSRVQFTPDLLPADVIGTRIYRASSETFDVELGPVFANFLLADEINRAPAKVQSALLEVMAERQVTIGGQTHEVPAPFLVMATQNPIESEGVYPLPEAQRDRFIFLVKVEYPSREEEREIVARTTGTFSVKINPVLSGAQIMELQKTVRKVPVPDHVTDFILDLVRFTRPNEKEAPGFIKDLIAWGAGPRACQNLVLAGKVRAVLKGRFHVTIDDVEAVALPIMRHRVVPTFNAEAEGITVDDIIRRIMKTIPRGEAKRAL